MTAPPARHPDAPAAGDELPSHFPLCFGCGSDHPGGLHLRVVAGPGVTMTGAFVVGESHQGAPGLIHGGVLSAAFDEVLGACNWLLMSPAVTARLEVDYRKPVPVGETVVIDARIDAVDGRKVTTSGRGTLTDGTLIGEALGLFIQVPLEHFAEHGRRRSAEELRTQLRPGLELRP